MLHECGNMGGTISIPTKFYWYLSSYELQCRCLDGGIRGSAIDPFIDSYLSDGEQEDTDEEEDDMLSDEIDESIDSDITLSGLGEDD